jgi:hypothetical protein
MGNQKSGFAERLQTGAGVTVRHAKTRASLRCNRVSVLYGYTNRHTKRSFHDRIPSALIR